MKEIELRIGNCVSYNGFACDVLGVASPQPHNDKRFDNKAVLDLFDGAGIITATIEEVSPIVLTEEMLLKCGFEKDDSRHVYEDISRFSLYVNDGFFFCQIDDVVIRVIRHVHELQNLYFSFTGGELR